MGKRHRGRSPAGTAATPPTPPTPPQPPPKTPRPKWLRLAAPLALLAAGVVALAVWYARRPPRTDAEARGAIARLRPQAGGLNLVVVTLDTTRADRLGCY